MPETCIYTDGSCNNAGSKKGSYGFIVIKDGNIVKEHVRTDLDTTSNRMELMGIISAMEYAISERLLGIKMYTDSQYALNVINGNSSYIANKDLVEYAQILYIAANPELLKVKGHSDNEWNNYIDCILKIH